MPTSDPIGAGEAGDAHPETDEKSRLEAFWEGRKSEAPGPHTGRMDDYL